MRARPDDRRGASALAVPGTRSLGGTRAQRSSRWQSRRKAEREAAGHKAAATRQENEAQSDIDEAKKAAAEALEALASAAKATAKAATHGGKAVAQKAKARKAES